MELINLQNSKLLFFRTSNMGIAPQKQTLFAAGYDIASAVDCLLQPHSSELLSTDIVIILPHGTYGRLASRSGLAFKHGIDVAAGVIDSDFRGTLKVLLRNTTDHSYQVRAGDRIAQLIVTPFSSPDLQEITAMDSNQTQRGASGFGSTGK